MLSCHTKYYFRGQIQRQHQKYNQSVAINEEIDISQENVDAVKLRSIKK